MTQSKRNAKPVEDHKANPVVTTSPYQPAYENSAEAREAIPKNEVLLVTVDIPTVVTTVTGGLGRLATWRARIVKELPFADIAAIDALEDRTNGLVHAHALYLGATTKSSAVPGLVTQALVIRARLAGVASTAASYGLLDASALPSLTAPTAQREVATDVLAITALIRGSWTALAGRVPTTQQELLDAEILAKQILDAIAIRDNVDESVAAAKDARQRQFTLVSNGWGEFRDAMTWIRRKEGDVDEKVPSLYAGRGGRGQVAVAPVVAPTPAPAPPETAPTETAKLPPNHPDASPFAT